MDEKENKPGLLWPNAVFIGLSALLLMVAGLMGAGKGCGGGVKPPAISQGGGDYVGVLSVEGVITSGGGGGGLFEQGGAGSDRLIKLLRQAEQDRHLKGLLLRVNSPGGSAPASEEIHAALMHFKRTTKKPVVVSMADVAASGGYYVSAPADKIFANRATFTGSIGVIFPVMNYQGLFEKIGLSDSTIISGKYKDIGNPTRPMTKQERAMLQAMSDEVHQQFIQAVYDGRKDKLSLAELKKVADGRILTGQQAHKAKLVDAIGSWQDAVAAIGGMTRLGPDPPLKPLQKHHSVFEELFGELRLRQPNPLAALPADPFSHAAATLLLARLPGMAGP